MTSYVGPSSESWKMTKSIKRVSHSSFPKRIIVHRAKSLVSSFISSDSSWDTLADVQRFERFADGANELSWLSSVEITPRKSVKYKAMKGSMVYYLAIRPMSFEERGMEAKFKTAAEHVKRQLAQLPTQDFSWETHPPYGQNDMDESYALEVIGENEQEVVHPNACLQDIDDKLLPKALQYFYQNDRSRMYKMCFKSSHGTAHLCVEKADTETCDN
uniref:Uncharacterized protein n=1 Tax=Oryza punctata TaxID=4537 RepID=A0A0E0LGH6_ORYPU